jgi:hypothetical protein
MFTYTARNNIRFAWYNLPFPYVISRILVAPVGNLLYGFKYRYPWATFKGLLRGYLASGHEFNQRHPVRRRIYRLFRRLMLQGPLKLEQVASDLPADLPPAPPAL